MTRALHDAVRAACAARTWSRGIELARDDAVIGEHADDDEIVLRVVTAGRAVAPTVVLYPKDEEWDCDCPSKLDPCEHVAAAVIAVTQARKQGDRLPRSSRGGGRVSYRFSRDGGGLALDRYIVQPDGGEHRIASTLSAVTSGRERGPEVTPTEEDLRIDGYLGAPRRGPIPAEKLSTLLGLLTAATDVRLDGEPVQVSAEALLPRARVEDRRGGAVRLSIEADPAITEVVAFGVARAGDTLHPLGGTDLGGLRFERLPIVREFSAEGTGELVTDVLPALRKRIPVEVATGALPDTTTRAKPRILFDVVQDGPRLSVMPTLVYGDPPAARIDGGRMVHLEGPVPVRDETGEQRLLSALRDELNLVPGRRVLFEGRDAIAISHRIARFAGRTRASEAPLGRIQPLVPVVDTTGGRFSLRFEVEGAEADAERAGAGGAASAAAALDAWREGFELAPLAGGGFGELPLSWLEEHGHRVAELLAAAREDGSVPAHAAPALLTLCDDLDAARPPELARLAPLVDGFDGIPAASLPDDLTATLREYQRRGVDWLAFLRDAGLGGVLADDMGLGKTLQALCAVKGRALVVCPTSVLENWAAEARRFRPAIAVSIYHGPRRALEDADLTLTTYGILRMDAERLAAREWDAVVLDEAQAIKNPDSQVARAAFALPARCRIALTGTPVENRLEELWSQLHFANPGLLGGRSEFGDRYARPIAAGDAGAAARLRATIRPFVLRRLKRDVAPELPPRTEQVLRCDLDARERAIYDAVRAATQKEVAAALGAGRGVLAALEALLRLRQAACHPALVPGQEAQTSSKLETLLESLDEAVAEGHKALVFSQWTSFLDLVEPALERCGIPRVRLDGSTRDRAAVVAEFQAEDGPPVMLVSLKAGGFGLNLTEADHVFLLDPWWNPAAEDQAADRAHRIGQTRPVLVYRLVARDTVEERILALQDRKRALADAALGEAAAAASITREDLMALLA